MKTRLVVHIKDSPFLFGYLTRIETTEEKPLTRWHFSLRFDRAIAKGYSLNRRCGGSEPAE